MNDSNRWLWLAGLLLCIWLVYLLTPILTPFLIGVLLAYLGDPLVDRLERWGLSRTWGVIAVFALFSLLLLVLLLVLVPMLGKQMVKQNQFAPLPLEWLQPLALAWDQTQFVMEDNFWQLDRLKAAFTAHLGSTTDVLGMILSSATASSLALLAWIGNLLLIPVVSFYLLRDWDLIMLKQRTLLPRKREGMVVR